MIALEELAQLEPVLVDVDGRHVALVRVDHEVFAFAAVCTHRPAPLDKAAVTKKATIVCPWHLGTFSLRTGAVTAGPPDAPLPVYTVEIVDGGVWLAGELPPPHRFPGHIVASCRLTAVTRSPSP